ncbi:MAG: hypothetical protein PVF27_01755 [Gemmatimonadales bacterium]|jgi:hypothetical protein
MRTALRVAMLALAFALGTWVVGWWAVPVLGLVWGAIASRASHPSRTAGASATLGWAMLLLWLGTQGPVWYVAQRVGPVLALPGWLFLGLTLIFPGVMALAAAAVAGEIAAMVRRSRAAR